MLANAKKCCRFYPSYRTWTNRGIAEFRLSQFSESVDSLREALRTEPIEYGEPDVKPFVEGYLTLAWFELGERGKVDEMRKRFEQKSRLSLWKDDFEVIAIANQIEQHLGPSVQE